MTDKEGPPFKPGGNNPPSRPGGNNPPSRPGGNNPPFRPGGNNPTIPSSGAQADQRIDANRNLAGSEDRAIAQGRYSRELSDSRHETALTEHAVYRRGLQYISFLGCIVITVMVFGILYILYHYMHYVIATPDELVSFVHEMRTIITGAGVYVVLQLVGGSIKRRVEESRKDRNVEN